LSKRLIRIRRGAAEWWRNPELNLDWKPFKIVPTYSYAGAWKILERTGTNPKFFALEQFSQYNSVEKLFIADASTTPIFTEVPTNWSSVGTVTSYTLVKWQKPYKELFIGSTLGIWRFEEDTNQFVSIWYWNWPPDKMTITSLGNAIYCNVSSWGSQSGYHILKPDGTNTYLTDPKVQPLYGLTLFPADMEPATISLGLYRPIPQL
jgi:hypothetical protein